MFTTKNTLATILAVSLILTLADCNKEEEKASVPRSNISERDRKRWTSEIKDYDKAIELILKRINSHLEVGNVLSSQGYTTGAMKAYKKATDLGPKLDEAIKDKEFAESKLGDH